MTEPTSRPPDETGDGIELEPISAGEPPVTSEPPGEEPIPHRPLHLCPNCDYNLTGLTSRRCPECGEPFSIPDARLRAFELSRDGREFRWWQRKDRMKLGFGIALLAFGLSCPCISHDQFSGTWHFEPSIKTWAMWMVLVPLVGLLLLINLYYEQSWSRALVEVGVMATVVGLIVAML